MVYDHLHHPEDGEDGHTPGCVAVNVMCLWLWTDQFNNSCESSIQHNCFLSQPYFQCHAHSAGKHIQALVTLRPESDCAAPQRTGTVTVRT